MRQSIRDPCIQQTALGAAQHLPHKSFGTTASTSQQVPMTMLRVRIKVHGIIISKLISRQNRDQYVSLQCVSATGSFTQACSHQKRCIIEHFRYCSEAFVHGAERAASWQACTSTPMLTKHVHLRVSWLRRVMQLAGEAY